MTDCDAKFRQHHATLEAGTDPATAACWPLSVMYVKRCPSGGLNIEPGDFPSPGKSCN